jgi:hypothetical protein
MNKLKLKTALAIVEDELAKVDLEKSYLEAAKKNLEALMNLPMPTDIVETKNKKEEDK